MTRVFEERTREIARLERFADLLDKSIKIPVLGWRVGLDPLVGLIPVVGDWLGAAASSWIVVRAAQYGVGRTTLLRMVANVALEATVGMIPVLGDLFDAWFRANIRNVELMRRDLEPEIAPDAEPRVDPDAPVSRDWPRARALRPSRQSAAS